MREGNEGGLGREDFISGGQSGYEGEQNQSFSAEPTPVESQGDLESQDTEIDEALKNLAVEVLGVERETVTDEAKFKDDLDADSLDLVELVMGIEERFQISVPEDKLEHIATIGQAKTLIINILAGKSGDDSDEPKDDNLRVEA